MTFKGERHLPDFDISIERKSPEEIAVAYKSYIESILQRPNLICRDGTLNQQELTTNVGDPVTREIVVFENNSLYDKHHFISSYPISRTAFEKFEQTGNIGLSPDEAEANQLEMVEAQRQQEIAIENEPFFFRNLPEGAHISKEQLCEVDSIKQQLNSNPNLSLTEKQQSLLRRAEKYKYYKDQFDQNNSATPRDEL